MFETTSKTNFVSTLTSAYIKDLNQKYKPLSSRERIKQLYVDFSSKEVMLTSSFAATSAFLLKLVSDINKEQQVFFIDTGYHFEDTLDYKTILEKKYNLNVTAVSANK